jgi:D-arabinose 1-dehydrogenase-like Zn-dependent alcohol dehydrogenase
MKVQVVNFKTTDRGVKYPLTPGHEIAGTIESMGEEAQVQGAAGEGGKGYFYRPTVLEVMK